MRSIHAIRQIWTLLSVGLIMWGPVHSQNLIDKKATPQTQALFSNLIRISEQGILFGHQETDAYGVGWTGIPGKSDVKEVCGALPAVHGWDIGREETDKNVDGIEFVKIRQWIKETYDRGGVTAISWHVDNPTTLGNAWDTVASVRHILPGGKDHQKFVKRLDHIASFLSSLKSGSTYIPVIFRPYHEHNGNWFWWGKGHCTETEYIQLWRFTVEYLKNEKNLHHLIYSFSPDRGRFNMDDVRASYLYAYPGDDYVDLLGYDNYMDVGIAWNKKTQREQLADLVKGLRTLSDLAKEKKKAAALTETGQEGITNPNWFTQTILNPLKENPDIKLSFFMVWRNANTKHHYAPYPGHASADDFVVFYKDPYTLFENDIQNLYTSGKSLVK